MFRKKSPWLTMTSVTLLCIRSNSMCSMENLLTVGQTPASLSLGNKLSPPFNTKENTDRSPVSTPDFVQNFASVGQSNLGLVIKSCSAVFATSSAVNVSALQTFGGMSGRSLTLAIHFFSIFRPSHNFALA